MQISNLSNVDLNTITIDGHYRINGGCTNVPITGGGWEQWSQLLVITGLYSDNATQIMPIYWNGDVWIRTIRGYDPLVWNDWKRLATATPPQEYNLPLVSSVREIAKCQYFQRQDKTTAFNLCCGATSGESISNNMPVANLPVGYQPTQQRFFPAVALNGAERFPGFVVASSNGELSWTGESIPYPGYIVSFGEFLVSENSTVSL